ncbi:MAG: U32 family peptidase, partial [Clostridia bacterium]|nr:U32 family peptidase [Clostridia bacterium]
YCEQNGISRAVLARETSLEAIRFMHENSPVELEFFCHGALCMGFSGSCLYSSMAGERSGNRGTCAQPCRKNATVLSRRAGQNEFALSTNDICMLDELGALTEAGICSFKIEGRMKSPEYVATVTRIYRAALDGEKPPSARRKLFEIFNRGEFSTAHIKGDSVSTGRVGQAKPPKELVAEAHESVRAERPVWDIEAELKLNEGERAKLVFTSGETCGEAFGPVCETPNKPVDTARISEQIGKLGGTPFRMKDIRIEGCGYAPVSALNAMRRSAAEELAKSIVGEPLEEKRIGKDTLSAFFGQVGPNEGAPKKYLRVRSETEAASASADIVGLDPVFPGKTELSALRAAKSKLVLILPNFIPDERSLEAYEKLLLSGVFCGVEVNNISHWELGRELPLRIAGVGMNVMNSASAAKALSMGFTHFMPSLEMTRPQLVELAQSFGSRMIVWSYGRAPLMQLCHCPVKEYRGCRSCRGNCGELCDGEGRAFPLENVRFPNGSCLVRMLNCAVTDVWEPLTECGAPVRAAAETPDIHGGGNITRGHWNRPVD